MKATPRSKKLGAAIKAARNALKLTQQQLGKRLDMSTGAVSLYERGLRMPGADEMPALAKALRTTTGALYGEAP